MDDHQPSRDQPASEWGQRRCRTCDSLLPASGTHCLMCGAEIDLPAPTADAAVSERRPTTPASSELPYLSTTIKDRQSPYVWLVTAIVALIVATAALAPSQDDSSFQPQQTPTQPALANLSSVPPTVTPVPLPSITPSPQPTFTPTPFPTPSPQPPIMVTVASGDSLFSLAFRYNVSPESVANLNALPADNAIIRLGQELAIPLPTATPPLTAVSVQIGDETLVADPTGCRRYEISPNDTLFSIASRQNVPFQALIAVNRLSTESLIQPGDTVCIPEIRAASLTLETEPDLVDSAVTNRQAPRLLYPPDQSSPVANQAMTFQWLAQRDLAPDEWYMIELRNPASSQRHPRRAFTRQASFQLPSDWLASFELPAQLQWRVYIINVVGERSDGAFIYTLGEEESGTFTLNILAPG